MKLDLGASIYNVAALLHDVVEDTSSIPLNDIERLFGETVARIVSGLN